MLSILFICETGISLSPLLVAVASAQAAQEGLSQRLSFYFCGAFAGKTARPIDFGTRKLLSQLGIAAPSSDLARECSWAELQAHQLIIATSEEVYWGLKRRFPELDNKEIRLILEFTDQLGMRDLADPLQGDISYEEAGRWAQRSVEGLFALLKQMLSGTKPRGGAPEA